jgi:DNA-binding PadR family transcriptional regulator
LFISSTEDSLSKNNGEPAQELEATLITQKRILKACLDRIILIEIAERNAINASHITTFVKRKFNIFLSSGTLYPVLYKLERTQKIRQLPKMKKKTFVLTKEGAKELEQFQRELGKIEDFFSIIFKADYWTFTTDLVKSQQTEKSV